MTTRTYIHGSKRATITATAQGFEVWVGFADKNEVTIPARFFKQHSTCSQTYKRDSAAVSSVQKFFAT